MTGRPRLGRSMMLGATALLSVSMLAGCDLYALPAGPGTALLTIKILVDLPSPLERAARLAIEQANAAHMSEFEGATLQEVVMNDTVAGSVDVGAAKQRLRSQLSQDSVLAMVGPSSPALALAELPITNNSDLAVVSPDLTNPCLTQAGTYCSGGEPNSLRPHNAKNGSAGDLTFFRVPTTDDVQASAAADYLVDSLGKHSALVVTDQTVSGQTLAGAFSQEWSARGETLVATKQVNLAAGTDLSDIGNAVAALKPDAVYFASTNEPAFAHLAHVLQRVPVTVVGSQLAGSAPFLSDIAGVTGDIHVSSLATDPANRAPRFVAAYRARYATTQAPPPFALEAYEATQAVIEGLRLAMAALSAQQGVGLPTKGAVQSAMAAVSIDTEDLTGVSFDSAGDDTSRLVTFDRLQNGALTFEQQVQFGG